MSAAKTSAERQREFRARSTETAKRAGLKMVRNLWARPDDFERIKAYVKRLNARKS